MDKHESDTFNLIKEVIFVFSASLFLIILGIKFVYSNNGYLAACSFIYSYYMMHCLRIVLWNRTVMYSVTINDADEFLTPGVILTNNYNESVIILEKIDDVNFKCRTLNNFEILSFNLKQSWREIRDRLSKKK